MKLGLTAPVERVFRSIEGESSRVGEITSFLKLGDGPSTELRETLAQVQALGPSQTYVIQTSNVIHFDWRHFVEEWVIAARQHVKVVHETRGDLLGPRVPTYLWLTPGVTTVTPRQLDPATDEVKLLVDSPYEIRKACNLLAPWVEAGYRCFLFPRVRTGHANFFKSFLRMHIDPPTRIRMMLIEHEVIGID